jgi:3-oxoacyl-[acyl-carrier-protein] synthase-3
MNGKEVYKFAVTVAPRAALEAVERAGLTVEDIDLFIPHQANVRIILSAADTLGIPPQRTFVNVDRYGNTSAASIPIALCEAVESGRVTPGANVLLAGFGGGLTWGAAVLRWATT